MTEAWNQWQGTTVNREFHLLGYLGGSENHAVFQIHCSNRDPQTAAIKLVAQGSQNVDNRLASWKLASTLSHANLIRIFQTGDCQIGEAKFIYVVMQYAEEDLSRIVPVRPLTETEVRELLNPALDALAYLHARGLAHGRIKPANIMASDDQLKLSTDGLRAVGEPISDPSDYDPPEAASSSAGDVWSLGMTLVELLTQRLPAWDRKAGRDPEVPECLPAPFLEIARHSLRLDPKRRWTIADIANRLKTELAAPRKEQPVPRNGSPTRSRYLILAVIFLLALAAVAGWKLLNHFSTGDAQLSPMAEKPLERASPELREGEAATPLEQPTTPSQNQSVSDASQVPMQTPLAHAAKAPDVEAGKKEVLKEVLPDVPESAINTIRGTVRVGIKASVDPSGNVTDATIDSPGPSKYFANLALQAAWQWKFEPTRDAPNVWALRFEFSADGVKAFAKQSGP
jgi:TonB family protein